MNVFNFLHGKQEFEEFFLAFSASHYFPKVLVEVFNLVHVR